MSQLFLRLQKVCLQSVPVIFVLLGLRYVTVVTKLGFAYCDFELV